MQKMPIKMSSASTEKGKRGNPCPTHRYFFKSLDILDIVQKVVQHVQLDDKGRFKITHKNCGVSGLLSLAQSLQSQKLEYELTRIPFVVSGSWR